jgi:hypothetical protein
MHRAEAYGAFQKMELGTNYGGEDKKNGAQHFLYKKCQTYRIIFIKKANRIHF